MESLDHSQSPASPFCKCGRVTKRTSQLVAHIEALLKGGATQRVAAITAGIDESMLAGWRRVDSALDVKVRAACAASEPALVQLVLAGAMVDGSIVLKLLERRHR